MRNASGADVCFRACVRACILDVCTRICASVRRRAGTSRGRGDLRVAPRARNRARPGAERNLPACRLLPPSPPPPPPIRRRQTILGWPGDACPL